MSIAILQASQCCQPPKVTAVATLQTSPQTTLATSTTTTTTTTSFHSPDVAHVSFALLQRLSIFEGQLVWIFCQTTTNNSKNKHSFVDDDKDEDQQQRQKKKDQSKDRNGIAVKVHLQQEKDLKHSLAAHDRSNENLIWIHPLTALNLNIRNNDGENDENQQVWIEPEFQPLRVARQVTLRPWGLPVHKPRLLDSPPTSSITNHVKEQQQQQQQRLMYPPFPASESILVPNKLVLAAATSPQSKERGQKEEQEEKNVIQYYYQVVQVIADGDSTNNNQKMARPRLTEPCFLTWQRMDHILARKNGDNNNAMVYQSDSNTVYRVETLPNPWTSPQLPPMIAASAFFPRFHPNLRQLVQALDLPGSASPEQRILVVLGRQSHHDIQEAVETAAAVSGRRCLCIQGLAAHAHCCSGLVRSGSLVDKLAGLQLALNQAYQAAPCVLLIQDVDLEWSSASHDVRFRHDVQARFWFLMTNTNSNNSSLCGNNDGLPRVPSVTIVLSMSHMPTKGPLLEHLIWEPIVFSLPDEPYAKYLWQQAMNRCGVHTTSAFHDIWSNLQGRTADEINHLAEQVADDINSTYGNHEDLQKDPLRLLRVRLEKLDKSYNQGSPSSSSRAQIPHLKWSDVGGLEHVRNEILETLELPLQYPHLFSSNTSHRRGILLYGPPGTGKTLVAKAVANECGLPFLSVKGPELLGSFVGESESNVRAVFAQARNLATAATCATTKVRGAILFFDELDSLAPRRASSASGGASVMDRVVATLFTELDRAASAKTDQGEQLSIFCIGATNRPDMLDPALLRPGRLGRILYLGLSEHNNHEILQVHLSKLKLPPGTSASAMTAAVLLDQKPKQVLLTGADLASIVSSALLTATQRLCDQAEAQSQRDGVSLDLVLAEWEENNQIEPVVQLEDVLQATRDVVPSVTPAQLARYEQLHEQMKSKS